MVTNIFLRKISYLFICSFIQVTVEHIIYQLWSRTADTDKSVLNLSSRLSRFYGGNRKKICHDYNGCFICLPDTILTVSHCIVVRRLRICMRLISHSAPGTIQSHLLQLPVQQWACNQGVNLYNFLLSIAIGLCMKLRNLV